MKKTRIVLMLTVLCMLMTFGLSQTALAVPQPYVPYIPGSEDIPRNPMASVSKLTVQVNGVIVPFEAYIIDGATYYKLRDIAYVITGTLKQFEVSWDGTKNAITIIKGQPYTPVGGEMTISAAASTAPSASGEPNIPATPTTSKIYCDGSLVDIKAYVIGGYNYMKIRDIAVPIGFYVSWNPTDRIITIDSTRSA